MKSLFSCLVLGVLFSCSSLQAAPDAGERAFRAGNALLEKRQYAKAVEQYRVVLKATPDEPSSLWNGGSAAFASGDFKTAVRWFARLQKQEPRNGHLLAKRLQTAQEIGDFQTRDSLRAGLFALHRSGKDTTGYASKPSFCRDQFRVGRNEVLVFEYFELKPPSGRRDDPYLGRRFDFVVNAPDEQIRLHVECGWSLLDVLPDGRFIPSRQLPAFYYDAYYPTGPWARRTFGLGPTEPAFEKVKAQVVAIIENRAIQVSGEKRQTEQNQ